MKEYDLRKEANNNMEYITPIEIRKWLSGKVNIKYQNIKSVFDPAVGSGQLFQFIKSEKYLGCDVNPKSLEFFKNNFKNSESYNLNYFEMKNKLDYELAISNYPFSLDCKNLFTEAPENLKQFFNSKNIAGKADFLFIIKSFLEAEKGGFYLCFPGITYRNQEMKYRDFLINNNYVESYGILKNCKFDATNIDVFYLELSKNKKDSMIETFLYDFNDKENCIVELIDKNSLMGENWSSPQKKEVIKKIDIEQVEREINFLKNKRRKTEDKLDKFIFETFKKKPDEVDNLKIF